MITEKKCRDCQETKPVSEYYLFQHRGRTPYYYPVCKPCQRLRNQKYKSREERASIRREHRQSVQDWINELKSVPCADCGVQYPPYVMDFDHVAGIKEMGISQMIGRYSRAALEEELSKCQVVCSNCHRERTHGTNC